MRFLSWLLQKLTFAVLLAGLGLTAFGLWVFLRDNLDFDLRRSELVRALTGESRRIDAAMADVEARMTAMRTEYAALEERAKQAARVAHEVESQSGGLSRLTGDGAQLRENDERLARLRQMESDAKTRLTELHEQLTRAQWEKDGLGIAQGRMKAQLKQAEEQKSRILHYAREAWDKYGWHVLVLVGLYFLGPPLGRVGLYYGFAPFVSRRSPVVIGAAATAQPEVTVSRASVDVALHPGDTLWVREKFLQASDEGLTKRTRLLLDWRMPFASIAAGLTELIEMRNGAAAAEYRATFSSQENAQTEVAVIALPAGSSMVVRPSFLAGLIGEGGRRVAVRRHWRLLTMQSWVTGQFRYFEFVGPCRLLIAGSRGVRAEVLAPRGGNPTPARRTNQDSTIGFTPGLAYRPVRAETLWTYVRGQNPLFDDLFAGTGVFLCQEVSAPGDAAQSRKFWAGLWSGLLRIFGL
ncbi:MAG: hypothetical protein HYV95_00340 [Opitutae bacterium]|nr:hypothetical protein [Opitutae bacterium]